MLQKEILNSKIVEFLNDSPGNIENCEYRQQRNDELLNYTFDSLR